MQVALRVFAALSILGGVAIVGVSFVYSVAATIILGGIPLILLGIASVYSSGQIKGASQA
ncbi:MAG: hypothetical protein JSS61_00575 [Verrucomicrobia bacterium]|nr:hypothetical protein [Verrucomicrobiota bacterium]